MITSRVEIELLATFPRAIRRLLRDVYNTIDKGMAPGWAFDEHWNIDPNYKFESEAVLTDGFFESRCKEWFAGRMDAEDIYRDLFGRIYPDPDPELETANHFIYVCENDRSDETRLIAKQIKFRSPPPLYWTQHWAMIANMCAYLYADALQKRLA